MPVRRVLRVITRLNIGGPARQALLLAQELAPEYETDLVAGSPEPSEGELFDPHVFVERAPLSRAISLRGDLQALRWLSARLETNGYDLAHTHMAKAGALTRLAALRTKPRPKLVHTFHGHVLDGYFSRLYQRIFVQIERFLARRTDALVAVSDHVRDELLALGIGKPNQWHVIPLGFDLEPMLGVSGRTGELRSRLGLGEEPLVGVLGRLAPIKDHAVLIDAVARLEGVHLAILGDGELRERLIARIESLEISQRVHMVGWWLDVPAAIADLDVVALTSRNEGTPVSLIEASACGRPVVATDVGGVRSVVLDGESGLLVPVGDSAAVAEGLGKVLSDLELARSMGAAGRAHVVRHFTKERLVNDISRLYASLLD